MVAKLVPISICSFRCFFFMVGVHADPLSSPRLMIVSPNMIEKYWSPKTNYRWGVLVWRGVGWRGLGGRAIGEKWVGAGVRWAWGFGKKSEFGAGVPEKEVRKKKGRV